MEKIMAKTLISGLKWCFGARRKREEFALQKLFPGLCPVIKLVRNVASDCGLINCVTNPSLILNIAKQISEQLSPTAAEAGCYDQRKTTELFGKEFNDRIQKLLNVCLEIDCSSAPLAPSDQIRKCEVVPLCRKVEDLWGQITEDYLKQVCALGRIGRKNKKDAIEIMVKQSVARRLN